MDQIHLLPLREQQKGNDCYLASWKAWPKNVTRLLVAPRKPSSSTSRAKNSQAEAEVDDADEGEFNGAGVSPNSPSALHLGIFLRHWKTGHDLLPLATAPSSRTTLTARLQREARRPILAARPPYLMREEPVTVPRCREA